MEPFASVAQAAPDAHRPCQEQGNGEQGAVDWPVGNIVKQRRKQHAAAHADGCKDERDEKNAHHHQCRFDHVLTVLRAPKWFQGGVGRS